VQQTQKLVLLKAHLRRAFSKSDVDVSSAYGAGNINIAFIIRIAVQLDSFFIFQVEKRYI
jgi:hypothetical protein